MNQHSTDERPGRSLHSKVAVVTNEAGDILAIGPASGVLPDADEEGGPTHGRFEPLEGQRVVEIDFTDELRDMLNDADVVRDLPLTHQVEAKGASGRLVARKKPKEH
jgi:hypothetical protein